mgnify:CR=1 FL=1|tara:strand:- start:103 stop:372 length:270 start_codon:yes stop_codon:yes gene_type:complete
MPKQLFKPQTFNCELTESQISTILYVLEGYSQGNDDEELVQEMDEIFKVLENVVPQDYYDAIEDGVVPSVELENVTDEWYDEEGNLKHD